MGEVNMTVTCRWFVQRSAVLLSLLLGATVGVADPYQNFALHELRRVLEAQIQEIRTLPPADAQRSLSILYFDLVTRRTQLEIQKSFGLNYSLPFLQDLNSSILPAVQKVAETRGLVPQRHFYETARAAEELQVIQLTSRLERLWKSETLLGQPLARKVLSYLALGRSGTLSSGSIGDTNPSSRENIQDSSLEGLNRILENIKRDPEMRPTLNNLKAAHAQMLGAAQHFFSQPGQFNDIRFTQSFGGTTPIHHYLHLWEQALVLAEPSLRNAIAAYDGFLHLHPFGDVNGRIAELSRQMILRELGLPPLLTPEKTAVENYFYQHLFGSGPFSTQASFLLNETLRVLEFLRDEIAGNFKIADVLLSGSHVILDLDTHFGQRRVAVLTKSFDVPEKGAVPPELGSSVIVGGVESALHLRYTLDQWKSQSDMTTKKSISTSRMGRPQTRYSLFLLPDVIKHGAGYPMSFVFFHHNKGNEISWLNNGGSNYSASLMDRTSTFQSSRTCSGLAQSNETTPTQN